MSTESTHKPSLATLPPELMKLIISDPLNFGGGTGASGTKAYHDQWLGVKLKYSKPYSQGDGPGATEAMATLRALSQTCKSLRNFTLPIIWAAANVSTMEQLGRLHEVMRAVPPIGAYIQSFSFSWDMDGDYFHCDAYTEKEAGSLLDFAFVNRLKVWDSLRKKYRCKVEHEGGGEESFVKWFTHEGRMYDAPGISKPMPGREDSWGMPLYNPKTPNSGGNGPDGKGEDKLIKTPAQFIECFTEVVTQLTPSLHTFKWRSPVTPIPKQVFTTLVKLNSITSLHLDMSSWRNAVHALPYWKLAGKLQSLSLDFGNNDFFLLDEDQQLTEYDEELYASFEVPQKLPTAKKDINSLHYSLASRTIIAAARGGHLKSLHFSNEGQVQPPFGMRALLPFWVPIESWRTHTLSGGSGKWVAAASTLRPLLAHSSLWLGTDTSPRQDRLLKREDVQALQSHFKKSGIPELTHSYRSPKEPAPVESYLPWLAEDEELAQQVADAWNKLVESGKADEIKCCCDKCSPKKKA